MSKSELYAQLEDITFAERDPDAISAEVIRLYEDASGRTLARADPVRLFLDSVILAIIQQRNVIDHAAKMNLLAYATGSYLDHIGALLGVTRLEASHAMTTVTFTLKGALTYPAIIPQGTRITPGDGVNFATVQELRIPTGALSGTVEAMCTEPGTSANGYVAGQIRRLVDVLPYDITCENVTVSSGGTDTEADDNYRERIQIAPESFSTAGPVKAYEYYARSANSDIIDVAVMGPPDTKPGYVEIYPLMTNGVLPSDEVLAEVLRTCSADNVRPDTDYVTVLRPQSVSYTLNMTYYIDESVSTSASYIQGNVEGAVSEWVLWQRKALGRDINPSELTRRVLDAGAKRCVISSPAFTVLRRNELAVCTSQSVIYGGLEER